MFEPMYVCPVEDCSCFVITWLGPFWDCGIHGEPMIYLPDFGMKLLTATAGSAI